jgi:general nucleoside transport system permease protein
VTAAAEATQERSVGLRVLSWRKVGILGIGLGALAFWIALPPLTTRTVIAPILVGLGAVALGAAAVARGEKRVGWGAVASGTVGMAAGAFATQASAQHLDDVTRWSTLFSLALVYATPLTFAAIGGMFSERSGVVNIGLEGMMLMGAFFGAWGADRTGTWIGGLVVGMVAGALLALVHAYFSIHLRADQIVIGTAVIFLAYGITGFLYNDIYGDAGTPGDLPAVPDVNLSWLSSIPPSELGNFLQESFGQMSLLTYVALGIAVVSYVVMFKTPIGLRIRSCGEHPRAADTVGINVFAVRYASVVTSGILAALGGVFLSIGFNHSFTEKMTAGYGFIALAALIFGNWRPFGAVAAALLFGFSTALAPEFENVESWSSYSTLFAALPYLLTLIAVAGVIGRTVPPAAIGRPYKKQ